MLMCSEKEIISLGVILPTNDDIQPNSEIYIHSSFFGVNIKYWISFFSSTVKYVWKLCLSIQCLWTHARKNHIIFLFLVKFLHMPQLSLTLIRRKNNHLIIEIYLFSTFLKARNTSVKKINEKHVFLVFLDKRSMVITLALMIFHFYCKFMNKQKTCR